MIIYNETLETKKVDILTQDEPIKAFADSNNSINYITIKHTTKFNVLPSLQHMS